MTGKISYSHRVVTIKNIGVLVILTAFFLSFAEAADERYGFSLSPNIGFIYGQAEEIVYKYSRNDSYLSELLWDLKPLVYVGLGADFRPVDYSRRQGVNAALLIKAGLPLYTGIIEDRDWKNLDILYSGFLTNYSRHDAYSRSSILLDVSAGYFWRLSGSLSLNVFGEISWTHFSWSANDGYLQYSSWDPIDEHYEEWDNNIPKVYKEGEVLWYKQDWFILSPGVSLNWNINNLFSLKGLFNYSPLIYCAARDDHLPNLPGHTTFNDYLYLGHYLKSSGELLLTASEKTSLSLSVSYKLITGSRGDTYERGRKYEDVAGGAYSGLDLGLSVKFRLSRE